MSTPREPILCQERRSASISYSSLESEEEVVQMTKNLCDNLEKWGNDQAATTDLHPRKKSRMTSSSGLSNATIPLLHGQGHYSPNHYSKDHLDLKLGAGGGEGQGPNSRHVKEKRNNNESCFRRVLSNEMEVSQLVPFSFMRGPWASPSPSPSPSPATAAETAHSAQAPKLNDLYSLGLQACRAGGFLHGAGKDPRSSSSSYNVAIHHSRSSSSSNTLKLPQDMQGRWSSERYKSAQLKLIDIMHGRRAQPGRPILRPVLREEARKHIGDTGLLDHLLKHMTDTVVGTGVERFRRRHNAQGAMEYWLEDASLMDIRKAAGIEDPSWLPPQGWKPGDKVWEISRRMSSSEAAEMSQLKDTVEVLKREMKFLFERLKDLKQMGVLQVVTLHDADRVRPTETDKAHLRPCDDLAEKIEKQQAEQITAAGNSHTVEWQLADIRKAISRMQSDVQCILELLG